MEKGKLENFISWPWVKETKFTFLWFIRGGVDVLGLVDLKLTAALKVMLLLGLRAELLLLRDRLLHHLLLLLLLAAKHVTHELLCEVLRVGHCPGLVQNDSVGGSVECVHFE